MIKCALAVAVALALAACDVGDGGGAPPPDTVESMYRVGADGPECDGPSSVQNLPETPPFMTTICVWDAVMYGDGYGPGRIVVAFERADTSATWSVAAYIGRP